MGKFQFFLFFFKEGKKVLGRGVITVNKDPGTKCGIIKNKTRSLVAFMYWPSLTIKIILAAFLPLAQSHGFSGCCGLIQKRGIGDVKAHQVRDHCLVVEQTLQATLSQLCLVRGVLCGPGTKEEQSSYCHSRWIFDVTGWPEGNCAGMLCACVCVHSCMHAICVQHTYMCVCVCGGGGVQACVCVNQ